MRIFSNKMKGLLVLVSFLGAFVGGANARDLSVEIASSTIDVTVGFNGAGVEVFGNRRGAEGDIAIILEGPSKDTTIWQKDRVMGTWVNRHAVKFGAMPLYYHYALNFSADTDEVRDVLHSNNIGYDALFKDNDIKKPKDVNSIEPFKMALLSEKRALGVYFEKAAPIKFMDDGFFRVHFDIPPSAPTGDYKIHSYLIKNGTIVEHDTDSLTVEQVGLNAFIKTSAHEHSLLYALTSIFFAAFAGWLISAVRVRP